MTVQADLCRTWSETPKTGFLALRPIFTVDKVFNDLSSENNKPSLSFLVCGVSHGLSHPLPLNMVMLKENRNNAQESV